MKYAFQALITDIFSCMTIAYGSKVQTKGLLPESEKVRINILAVPLDEQWEVKYRDMGNIHVQQGCQKTLTENLISQTARSYALVRVLCKRKNLGNCLFRVFIKSSLL